MDSLNTEFLKKTITIVLASYIAKGIGYFMRGDIQGAVPFAQTSIEIASIAFIVFGAMSIQIGWRWFMYKERKDDTL